MTLCALYGLYKTGSGPAGSENGGLSCCHCSIRRPRPVSGKVRLRAPPGGMSARSRAGSRRFGDGCLYETCSGLVGVLVPRPCSPMHQGIAWDFMGRNKKFQRSTQDLVPDARQEQELVQFPAQ